ncbi:MAG: CDP-alcohol phosphatidyltransferase family protein [Bacteroidota bacterium]
MRNRNYYIINGITIYRLLAAPLLVFLIFYHKTDLFKWLLAVSFFTDMIDGYLARRFKVASILGSKLDSIADDMTIVAAIVGVFVLKPNFIHEEFISILILLVLFILQTGLALIRYHKVSSFHTYFAKLAALLQGSFLILVFFLAKPLYSLFYAAALITAIDLIEEIILVILLPEWEANVKGIYWVMKRKKTNLK